MTASGAPVPAAMPAEAPPAEPDPQQAWARAYGRKMGLTTAAFGAAGLGLLFTILFAVDFDLLLRWLELDAVVKRCEVFVTEAFAALSLPGERLATVTASLARMVMSSALNLVAMLGGLIAVLVARKRLESWARERGEFSDYGLFCLRLSRQPLSASLTLALSGLVLSTVGAYFVVRVLGVTAFLYLLPLTIGLGLGLVVLAAAVAIDLELVLDAAGPLAAPKPVVAPQREEARAKGTDLLERLRQSPAFRRQVFCDVKRPPAPFGRAQKDGLDLLGERYPELTSFLAATGINCLSDDQTTALRSILQAHGDHVLVGAPGSGRSTLANLLALASVLHHEGAIYCVTAESAQRSVDRDAGAGGRARHPVNQIRDWVSMSHLEEVVRVQEAYLDSSPGSLRLDERPDIVYTDVRVLSRAILSGPQTRDFLSRLKYIVIDHPNRLPREDLVRLRIAIGRLRLTAEMFGRQLRFLLILPPLANFQKVAKYLLSTSHSEFTTFRMWPGACRVVGWLPPLELADIAVDDEARFVRADFTEEVTSLLTEIGVCSSAMAEPLRVAVVDPLPLLGPEARETVRRSVSKALAAGTPAGDTFMVKGSWTYYGSAEIAVDLQREFDVVVCLGLGPHPEYLVSSLRAAVADQGLLILVGASSSADVESLRRIDDPTFDDDPHLGPDPETGRSPFPRLLLPDHAEAVVAHELASLFEDFGNRALPLDRLLDVFPVEQTPRLIREWTAAGNVEEVHVFEGIDPTAQPEPVVYVRRCTRKKDGLSGSMYEVPWGCCSRRVLRAYDYDANRYTVVGPYVSDYLDEDRLFIDVHPQAILRYPPNTVLVARAVRHELSAEDRKLVRRRWVNHGDLYVREDDFPEKVAIDRRRARYDVELLGEWALLERGFQPASEEALKDVSGHPVAQALRLPAAPAEAQPFVRRALLSQMVRPALRRLTGEPRLNLLGGYWVCRLNEKLRDVVKTDGHLAEEALFTDTVPLPAADTELTRRTFECLALSFFLAGGAGGEAARRGEPPAFTPKDACGDYASHHALARAIENYLSRFYLNFANEYRIALVPNTSGEDPVGGLTSHRILVHQLRADEVGWVHPFASLLLDPEDLRSMLEWIRSRLETCDCADGCAVCCGGLGTIPAHELPRHGFTRADAISRAGAYQLVSGLLGSAADWMKFGLVRRGTSVPTTAETLKALVAEIVGTDGGGVSDGLLHELFRDSLSLPRDKRADVVWMSPDADPEKRTAGFYSPDENRIQVRPAGSEDWIKTVLVHELAHNWQYKSGVFDLQRHRFSDAVQAFFEGKLVVEGHATWAETRFRLYRGLGATYGFHDDDRPWNEYKAGYFLMEGIERSLGEAGLYVWLCLQTKEDQRPFRSRDGRFLKLGSWSFTAKQALEELGLLPYVHGAGAGPYDVREPAGESS